MRPAKSARDTDAARARQTVIAVCGQMDISPDQISWDARIYGGWTASLVSVLTDCPNDARRVWIAGHNCRHIIFIATFRFHS